MAAERGALSESEFISQMAESGVRAATAKFVWDEAQSYYYEPLKPDPNDHGEGTMQIDPEDLEDITAKFWTLRGWQEPSIKDPVVIPTDPTLLEYGLWLDQQRQFQQ